MTKEIIARYSILKVGGWVVGVALGCAWLYLDGASRGWRSRPGPDWLLFPAAVVGSVVLLTYSVALVLTLVRSRGAAIARVDEQFVLYFPFSTKRVALSGAMVSATEHVVFKITAITAQQVTIHRPGQTDLNFRTGLLQEKASVIAKRMSALIQTGAR